MKFLTSLTAVASILSVSIAAPMSSPVENALEKRDQCQGHTHLLRIDYHAGGGGYNRWFWKYAGFTCKMFDDALNRKGVLNGPIGNRVSCDDEELTDEMHVTTWKGDPSSKAVLSAVKSITGQPCDDFALPSDMEELCNKMIEEQYFNSGCQKS